MPNRTSWTAHASVKASKFGPQYPTASVTGRRTFSAAPARGSGAGCRSPPARQTCPRQTRQQCHREAAAESEGEDIPHLRLAAEAHRAVDRLKALIYE